MDGQSAKMLQLVLCCLFCFKESTQVYNKDVFMLQVLLDQCFINSSKKTHGCLTHLARYMQGLK